MADREKTPEEIANEKAIDADSSLTAPQRKDEKEALQAERERQERLAERTVWNVTLWGVAKTPEEAEETVRAVVEEAKKGGMRSGFANAPNVPNVTLSASGIPHRRAYLDPTTEEAVSGVGYVKNTPLDDDGLPDPRREVEESPQISGEVPAADGGKETPRK